MKIIALILFIALLLSSCVTQNTSATNMPIAHPLEPCEDGLFRVNIPISLLNGWTEKEYIEGIAYNEEALGLFLYIQYIEDTGIVITYDSQLYKEALERFYTSGMLHIRNYVFSIKNVVYHNELLSEITVYVDASLYNEPFLWNERHAANVRLATWAGNFQLLSGVAPDEWFVDITVRCYDTNAIISRNSFPSDDMFEREHWEW